MKRREFLKSSAAAGALIVVNKSFLSAKPDIIKKKDITYNTLPLWKGFNLQEKFTHKPDEWMDIAPE